MAEGKGFSVQPLGKMMHSAYCKLDERGHFRIRRLSFFSLFLFFSEVCGPQYLRKAIFDACLADDSRADIVGKDIFFSFSLFFLRLDLCFVPVTDFFVGIYLGPMEKWANFWDSVNGYLVYDNNIGPKFLAARHVINLSKCTMPLWIYYNLNKYNAWTSTSKLYWLLHGSYGLFWFYKDYLYGDKSWKAKVSPLGATVIIGILSIYQMPAYIIASQNVQVSTNQQLLAIGLFVWGVVFMMGADAQKYFTLRHKKGLIHDGFFTGTRNPNYLGEVMLYASFAVLTGNNKYFWMGLMFVWATLFIPNMVKKDRSLKKKEGSREYFAESWMFFPHPIGLLKGFQRGSD